MEGKRGPGGSKRATPCLEGPSVHSKCPLARRCRQPPAVTLVLCMVLVCVGSESDDGQIHKIIHPCIVLATPFPRGTARVRLEARSVHVACLQQLIPGQVQVRQGVQPIYVCYLSVECMLLGCACKLARSVCMYVSCACMSMLSI